MREEQMRKEQGDETKQVEDGDRARTVHAKVAAHSPCSDASGKQGKDEQVRDVSNHTERHKAANDKKGAAQHGSCSMSGGEEGNGNDGDVGKRRKHGGDGDKDESKGARVHDGRLVYVED